VRHVGGGAGDLRGGSCDRARSSRLQAAPEICDLKCGFRVSILEVLKLMVIDGGGREG